MKIVGRHAMWLAAMQGLKQKATPRGDRMSRAMSRRINIASESDTDVMPTFLIIGAQKCGTTALYHYMNQHPDVFMSPTKEPNFFAFENQSINFRDADGRLSPIATTSITDLSSYQDLFSAWNGERAVGEASPHYLYLTGSAERIKRHIPRVKLIAILRNPIDRAYSAYLHARRAKREPIRNLYEALSHEDERIRTNHGYIYHYTRTGMYYSQLVEYYRVFPTDQLKVYLYDDFARDTAGIVRDIYEYIDVNISFRPNVTARHNESGLPRNMILHNIYRYISSHRGISRHVPEYIKDILPTTAIQEMTLRLMSNNLYKPPMPPECFDYLKRTFETDIERLQELLDRDLSGWLIYR